MQPLSITDGTSQPLTAAGPAAPSTGLDISALAGAYMFEVEVTDLHSASGTPRARIVFEDTVNAFTAAVPVAEFTFTGPIAAGVPVKMTAMHYSQAAGLRIGAASAKLRANVVALDGGTPSLTFRAALHN
jgi:hypothetical protein